MKERLLFVENLCVSFSMEGMEIQAVQDVCFDLFPGESVGIVGESGSGKSTIVQAITRLSHATKVEGSIVWEGVNLNDLKNSILGTKIGMVFQDPLSSLNPTMKISQQIEEGMIYHKLANRKEARQKSLELLQLVDISDPHLRLAQYPHELSGGMRQRVAIAIALACNPRLLIADEPTSALDVTTQAQVLKLIQQIQIKRNMSLLLITHDLKVVAEICDRILVLHTGKIVEQGPVQEILLSPKHPYTQMLIKAQKWGQKE